MNIAWNFFYSKKLQDYGKLLCYSGCSESIQKFSKLQWTNHKSVFASFNLCLQKECRLCVGKIKKLEMNHLTWKFFYIYYDTIGRAPSELSVTLANKDSNVLLLLADVELKEGTSQLKLEVNLRFLLFQSRFSGIGI